MRGDVRGIDISRVILVYVFTASIMLGATAQNPTSIVASTITNKIKNPATITATAKKTLKTIKTLAPTVATTVATTVAKPTVLSDKKPTTLPHMENDRAKADIKDGYTSLKKAQLPDVAKELTENTRVHIEAKDIKDIGVETVNDWANWNLLTFFVNITFAESEKLTAPCTYPSDRGDFAAALRDVANFRPEYTTISFVACKHISGDLVMVFRVSHTSEVVVSGGGPAKVPFYESRLFIFSAIGGGGGFLVIVLSIICFLVGKGYQDRKAKRWLNTYQRRMAEQDSLQQSSSLMMSEKYREMPNDFVQV